MTTEPSNRRALFAEIVEQHGAALSRLSAGYERDPARREELLQEIWLALWGALEKFRGDASLRTWMYRVAHNVAITHVHRARRATPSSDGTVDANTDDAAPDVVVEDARRLALLRDAIDALAPLDRQLVLLYLEEIPQSEIAAIAGITTTNVATRLGRIKAALARTLDPKGNP